MSRRSRFRGSRGFTLIEILIAFAILAVALVVLFRAFSDGFTATGRAESMSTAVLLARSTLERVGVEIPVREGRQEGRTEEGADWIVDITRSSIFSATALRGAPVAPYEVRVTVSLPGTPEVTLTTLRLGSAAQGAP